MGILAQRAQDRPNLNGVSRCHRLAVDGRSLRARGLDAVDDSPVLDIKPCLHEFGPPGEVWQPAWSHELMQDYYREQAPAQVSRTRWNTWTCVIAIINASSIFLVPHAVFGIEEIRISLVAGLEHCNTMIDETWLAQPD